MSGISLEAVKNTFDRPLSVLLQDLTWFAPALFYCADGPNDLVHNCPIAVGWQIAHKPPQIL